ncbi:MAG: ornithine cyclodeaminase family protein [Caldilineaceae bacterium]
MPLWLTRADVQSILTMPAAIDAVEQAFALLSRGQTALPLRTNMPVAEHSGSLLAMPAYVGGESGGLGVKLITLYAGNPQQRSLPAIQGNFVLFDPVDGRLLAILEAGYMTAVRTGASGGVAARHLARADARTLTIFGSGAQAPFQVEAVCAERPIERVYVLSQRLENAQRFAAEQSRRLDVEIVATDDVAAAVRAADVIVTATSAHAPLFDGDWLRPGTHVNAVGAHLPTAREVDTSTIRRAKVVTDQTSACLAEAGDLIVPIRENAIDVSHIYAEIGRIAAGDLPGRADPDEITFFKSVGLAVQDVAVASLIVQQALARGIGQHLEE